MSASDMQDQIDRLGAINAELMAELDQTINKALNEDRDLDDAECEFEKDVYAKIEENQARIDRLIRAKEKSAEVQSKRDDNRSRIEVITSRQAKPAVEHTSRGAPMVATKGVMGRFDRDPSCMFAKYAHFLFRAQGHHMHAAELAQNSGDREMATVIRAVSSPADTSTPAWAGELLRESRGAFFDLLRPMTLVGRIPGKRQVTFTTSSSIRVPRMSAGAAGSWVGEGTAIPVRQQAYASKTLEAAKMGCIVVSTREMLGRSDPSLERIIRDDLVESTARAMDNAFFSTNAAVVGTSPAGYLGALNIPAPLAPSAAVDPLDAAREDISAILNAVESSNVSTASGVWVMHPSVRRRLSNLTTANGDTPYRDELNSGTLEGFPVITSNSLDVSGNSGGTSAHDDLIFIPGSSVLEGVGDSFSLEMSFDASLHMEDTSPSGDIGGATTPVMSLFQRDSAAIRLVWDYSYMGIYGSTHANGAWIDALAWV